MGLPGSGRVNGPGGGLLADLGGRDTEESREGEVEMNF